MTEDESRRDSAVASLDVPVDPCVVWRALVDRASWWPALEFDAVSGAPLRETWTDGDRTLEATGRVLVVDEPSRLSFEWTEPGWRAPLAVDLTVGPGSGGSTVTVTESGFTELDASGFDASGALRLEHEEGWQEHLQRLHRACLDLAARSRPSAGA